MSLRDLKSKKKLKVFSFVLQVISYLDLDYQKSSKK